MFNDILKKTIQMINCGELRIVYKEVDYTFTGVTINKNEQTVIILNSKYSYEYNLNKLIHEITHIRQIKENISVKECEKQAEETENNPVAKKQLVNFINKYEHTF
ncbi:hypothetical protein [Clostridium sp. BL-8]|uniref:hypothetical protein n=1 Tax=Clostridium sp. BL-8 TaxID=349938 RepID=UPI00098CD28E|nr:hypothetical protein [Clostridium sp. BL-8]OOM69511.1 hypothetical protein CLOBL_52090 [Clostridium sp. BL-8]